MNEKIFTHRRRLIMGRAETIKTGYNEAEKAGGRLRALFSPVRMKKEET